MKVARVVLKVLAAAMVVAAAVCAVVVFWDKIVDLFYTVADKLEEKKADRDLISEFDDYADCEL